MALINHRAREVHFKLVYCGPGAGGKTTNLQRLYERLPADRRGRLVSLATDHERTLFFDFLPIELGEVNGLTTRFHLYTVPGQVYYRLSRRAVLQGADGIAFVADSHPAREQANRESLADLEGALTSAGLGLTELSKMPRVFQYNKRDLPSALPITRMRAMLNPDGAPEFPAIARDSQGVAETLRSLCKSVLARLAGAGWPGAGGKGISIASVATMPAKTPVAAPSAAPPQAPIVGASTPHAKPPAAPAHAKSPVSSPASPPSSPHAPANVPLTPRS
jgi:signal recognition particle receptor subunit beta